MQEYNEFIPLIIGLGVVHLLLVVYSIWDILKHGQFMLIGKIIWIIIVLYVVITGPVLYLLYGRGERSWSKKMIELQQQAREQIEKDRQS